MSDGAMVLRAFCVWSGDGGGIVFANAIETRHSMIFIWNEWEMIYVYWWGVCVCAAFVVAGAVFAVGEFRRS